MCAFSLPGLLIYLGSKDEANWFTLERLFFFETEQFNNKNYLDHSNTELT